MLFLLLLFHQIIVLKYSRFTSVIIGFIQSSDSRCVVFNMHHVWGRVTWDIIRWVALGGGGVLLFLAARCEDTFIISNTNQLLYDKEYIIRFKLPSLLFLHTLIQALNSTLKIRIWKLGQHPQHWCDFVWVRLKTDWS